MSSDDTIQRIALELSNRLSDEGKLIEAGWVIFRGITIPQDAPENQVFEMRFAFMAGAQHLFASIMTILDPGEEPTEQDLKRIDLINNELGAFIDEMELRYNRTKGSA